MAGERRDYGRVGQGAADLDRHRQALEAAGRAEWERATREGRDVQARTAQELRELGARMLAGRHAAASNGLAEAYVSGRGRAGPLVAATAAEGESPMRVDEDQRLRPHGPVVFGDSIGNMEAGGLQQRQAVSADERARAVTVSDASDAMHGASASDGVGEVKQSDLGEVNLRPYRRKDAIEFDENSNLKTNADKGRFETAAANFVDDLFGPDHHDGNPKLGTLSARYESNGDPGTVSSGKGDLGGVSYGSYQLSSTMGAAAEFIASDAAAPWSRQFSGLTPGTNEFSGAWRAVAAQFPNQFKDAQHDYIKKKYYEPVVKSLYNSTGIDFSSRSHALQDVIWSTAVQHGLGAVRIIDKALNNTKNSGYDTFQNAANPFIIQQIYGERGRADSAGNLVRFRNSSPAVQRGVASRYAREQVEALNMLYGS